ncbi:MAG: glycosyltransferase family 2 protein [Syntrophales bacterium]|nr:glycosyltransferase family 2 protein [Syntrophales bacterium]
MISVIIPVYNEVATIAVLYERLREVLTAIDRPWEIIFINDGSTDGSKPALDLLADKDDKVKVIHFRRNFGQTTAMMAGIDFARGDILISMDGDLQNDPADIPMFLEKLEQGFDVCSGWRKNRQDSALKRVIPSRIANFLISRISGVHLPDYGCSLKAYKKEVIKGVKLYGEMHRFIPIYASWQGARVTEIPVTHHPRRHGTSKYGLERTLKVILDLIVVKFLANYAQKPIYVFGYVGLVSILIAIAAAGASLYYKFFGNKSFISTPLPLLFVLATITGVMCILMGLLAEIVIRTYYESQNKPVYLIAGLRNLEPD